METFLNKKSVAPKNATFFFIFYITPLSGYSADGHPQLRIFLSHSLTLSLSHSLTFNVSRFTLSPLTFSFLSLTLLPSHSLTFDVSRFTLSLLIFQNHYGEQE